MEGCQGTHKLLSCNPPKYNKLLSFQFTFYTNLLLNIGKKPLTEAIEQLLAAGSGAFFH